MNDWNPSPEALAEWGEAARSFATWQARYGPRFLRVEHDSHPPVPFVECSECHAVMFESSFDQHREWHQRQ